MAITSHDDAAQLAELGYESRFERRMGLWENFALGFTYLSPVVGVYSTFALGVRRGRAADDLEHRDRRRSGSCWWRSCSPRSWPSSRSPAASTRGRGG